MGVRLVTSNATQLYFRLHTIKKETNYLILPRNTPNYLVLYYKRYNVVKIPLLILYTDDLISCRRTFRLMITSNAHLSQQCGYSWVITNILTSPCFAFLKPLTKSKVIDFPRKYQHCLQTKIFYHNSQMHTCKIHCLSWGRMVQLSHATSVAHAALVMQKSYTTPIILTLSVGCLECLSKSYEIFCVVHNNLISKL